MGPGGGRADAAVAGRNPALAGRVALARVADRQTRTTHGSPETLAASAAFAAMLADSIGGMGLGAVLSSLAAAAIEWRGLHRETVEGSGYVVRSLQAAVWAVSRTTDFRSAVLLAANLGQDADTTAAIAGQLAGAVYGVSGIPAEWLSALAWRDHLAGVAGRLFDAAWPEDDVMAGTATSCCLKSHCYRALPCRHSRSFR